MLKTASKLVSTDQLITPISLAGDVTLSTGNLVIDTAGKGIDFSATPGTGTSELLADYEEGTWTPADGSGAALTLTSVVGTYTKIGRQITASFSVTYPTTANAANAVLSGLPFVSKSNGVAIYGGLFSLNTTGTNITLFVNDAAQTTLLLDLTGAGKSNASLSTAVLRGVVVYET